MFRLKCAINTKMRDFNNYQKKDTKKNLPVFTSKYGLVQASVWEQETENGSFLSISYNRSYKDKKDEWQKTQSLRVSDIKDLQSALEECYIYARHKKE